MNFTKNSYYIIFILFIILMTSCNRRNSLKTTFNVNTFDPKNLSTFQREQGILTPQQFGAIGDGITNDQPAFQAMFDYLLSADRPFKIEIPPQLYYLGKTVLLPIKINNECLYINGNGATLIIKGNFPVLEKQAQNLSDINNYRLILDGLTFRGEGIGVGLLLRATYTAQVSNCHFIHLGVGIKSLFSLNGLYQNLRFTNCTDVSFFGGYGDWDRAGKTSSAFNANLLQNIRVYGKEGQEAHYKIVAGDNNVLSNCISEGVSPKYNVLIDSENSSVVNHFISIYNFWIESRAATLNSGSTYFEFKNLRGLARLTDVQAFPGVQRDTLINNPHSNSDSQIILDGYRGNCTLINNTVGSLYGTYYIVKNSQPSPLDKNPFLDKNNWIGRTIPIGLIVENFRSQNTGHMNISDHRSRSILK